MIKPHEEVEAGSQLVEIWRLIASHPWETVKLLLIGYFVVSLVILLMKFISKHVIVPLYRAALGGSR